MCASSIINLQFPILFQISELQKDYVASAGAAIEKLFKNPDVETADRLGFMGPTYVVGDMVIIYYRQVFPPLGFAWLCERWYRILLIGCLCLSLRCDTWFVSSYANSLVSSDDY